MDYRRVLAHVLTDALKECDFVYFGEDSIEVGVARFRDALWMSGYRIVEREEAA